MIRSGLSGLSRCRCGGKGGKKNSTVARQIIEGQQLNVRDEAGQGGNFVPVLSLPFGYKTTRSSTKQNDMD